MKGNRFGVVIDYGRSKQYHETEGKIKPYKIRLDRTGRVDFFHPSNVLKLEG